MKESRGKKKNRERRRRRSVKRGERIDFPGKKENEEEIEYEAWEDSFSI
jgi:hypothetical protein